MKRIIKVLILVLVGLNIFGCGLFDVNEWKEAHQRSVERGRTCYERANGDVYCKDTK